MTEWTKLLALGGLLCIGLAGCGRSERAPRTPPREDWIIDSRIVIKRGPLEPGYRLIVPARIAGYGVFTDSESYLTPELDQGGNFELDLNQGHDALLAEMKKTEKVDFNFDYMLLETKESRFAILTPYIVDRRTKDLGQANWVDRDTELPLKLYYFDRPTRITGKQYDIDVKEAGYYWIGPSESRGDAQAVQHPNEVMLSFYFRERV
jgi:hypothetical protein